VLPKEEKQVKGWKVVVRHGGGDRGLPFALHGALQDTVALAKCLHNCLEEQKQKGVKRGEEAFWRRQTWRTEQLAVGFRCPHPYKLYTDSQASLSIASNASKMGKIRHIAIRYHLVRSLVTN
jgi:hypothetical protein